MFEMPRNHRTVTLKLKRYEVFDLLMACTKIAHALRAEGKTSQRWDALHDKLWFILTGFDQKQERKEKKENDT